MPRVSRERSYHPLNNISVLMPHRYAEYSLAIDDEVLSSAELHALIVTSASGAQTKQEGDMGVDR